MTNEYQAHSGAVHTGSSAEVQYAYNEMNNGTNNSRLVSMNYPNGYQVTYNYNGSGLDDSISRLSSLSDSYNTLESYLYLGLDTVVQRARQQGGIWLTYIAQNGQNGPAGDQYAGLDQFGRVVDQNWYDTTTQSSVDDYQYGYNADGEVLYAKNTVDANQSALYSYDNLGQLTSFQRGQLNASNNGIVGTPSESQSWSPDALGNFTSVSTNGSTQTRTANQQNEYTTLSGQSGAPTYDANGNLTADGKGNTYAYDAWNRLVSVKNNGTTVASYVYDGLNRRIQITENGMLTDLYYSSSGQSLEEYIGGAVSALDVWSPVYVNALVFRETDPGEGQVRYYALQDADWNVTAWEDASGTIDQRFAYDPYGAVTVMSAGWVVQGSNSLGLPYGFQGMSYDWFVSMNFTTWRVYNPALMRWQQIDPLGQVTGPNGYVIEGNGPINSVDPSGLAPPDMSEEEMVWTTIEQIYADEGYDLDPQDLLDAVAEYLDTSTQSVVEHVASYLEFYNPSGIKEDDIDNIKAQSMRDFSQYFEGTVGEGGPKTVGAIGEMGAQVGEQFLSWVPGPEILLFKAFAKLRGFQYLKKGGKWILQKVVCKEGVQVLEAVGETEAKALYAEFKKAPGKIVDFSGELVRDRANATRSLRNALGTNSQISRPHHIIPWEAKDLPIVQAAARGGFNINGADNGINLLLKVHRQGARHPRYNAAVMKMLEALGKRKLSDAEAAAEVQAIADQLRRGLARLNQSGVSLK